MAEQLDVSRTTVRAAVAILEQEGKLTVKRGRGGGFIVSAPEHNPATMRQLLVDNRREIRQAFEYRAIVESAAARLAASRRTETELITLRAMVESMNATLERCLESQIPRDIAEFLAIDTAFHLGIATATRNPYLIDAVKDARKRMWNPVGSLFGRLEENANDFHQEILEALEQKKPALAEKHMSAHVNDTMKTLESWSRR